MEEQLVETWMIHDRINRYLLDAVPEDALVLPRHRSTGRSSSGLPTCTTSG